MGANRTGEPFASLTCAYCMKDVTSYDHRCICGAYRYLVLKQRDLQGKAGSGSSSLPWEVHRCVSMQPIQERVLHKHKPCRLVNSTKQSEKSTFGFSFRQVYPRICWLQCHASNSFSGDRRS